MQLTIFTIPASPHCEQEKEYLTTRGITYSEVVLDGVIEHMKDFLTISGGFSGVPVTLVTTDDGVKTIVKGFNKEELDNVLGSKDKTKVPAAEKEVSVKPLPEDDTTSVPVPQVPPVDLPTSTPLPDSPLEPQSAVNAT